MAKIRALVVDDSTLLREQFALCLDADPAIEVVGTAKDGSEAVELAASLRPDVITMDLIMPVMDGLEAIGRIMATNAVPILVVTDKGDAKTGFEALSKGALEVLSKSEMDLEDTSALIDKVKFLSGVRVITHIGGKRERKARRTLTLSKSGGGAPGRAVAIASSTGGPKALSVILPEFPKDFPCPVVVAQHIADGFAEGLAEWLNNICRINVKIGEEGERLLPGTVYVSPSDSHMEVTPGGRLTLVEVSPGDTYRPSCDRLMASVARAFGPLSVGAILTGMGNDGAEGIRLIKESGGVTIAQDEATSVVYGMPKVAVDGGSVDFVVPLEGVAEEIRKGIGQATGKEAPA